jgi:hypothetical protein
MGRRVPGIGEPLPLDDYYANSVVFVLRPKTDDEGTVRNVPIATGFVVSCPSELDPTTNFNYVVTANHAVEDGKPTLVRLRTDRLWSGPPPQYKNADGSVVYPFGVPVDQPGFIDLPVREWLSHPKTDVAIAPLRGAGLAEAALTSNDVAMFHDSEERLTFQPWLGQRVYFAGLFDRFRAMGERNVPLVRSGTLGAFNVSAVPVGRGHKARILPEAHLIDCRSYQGFSGSPCYVQEDVPERDEFGGRVTEYLTHNTALLGIVAAHFDIDTVAGDDEAHPIELDAPMHSGVGVVIPATRIKELMYMDELKEDRERIERERHRRIVEGDEGATLDSGESEYDRFEGLTRKLVNTPKPEKDEKPE